MGKPARQKKVAHVRSVSLKEDVKDIIDAINGVFGDTSVSKETTLEFMEEIEAAVEVNVSALKS